MDILTINDYDDVKRLRKISVKLPRVVFAKIYSNEIVGAVNEVGDIVVLSKRMMYGLDKSKWYNAYDSNTFNVLKDRGFKVEYCKG